MFKEFFGGAIAVYGAVAYAIWVISVRVLRLFHNNSVELQLIHLQVGHG